MVSRVVKVLDTTMNSVSAGSRSWVASQKSVPSMLDTKRTVRSRSLKFSSASYAMAGPRSLPPMPMLTRLRMGRPVWPVQDPERMASAKPAMASSTACTSGTTSTPSTSMTWSAGARRATCSTARSSVTLILSPANMASRSASTPARRARAASRPTVSVVRRCLE